MNDQEIGRVVDEALEYGYIDYDGDEEVTLYYNNYEIWVVPKLDRVYIAKFKYTNHWASSIKRVTSEEQANRVKETLKAWEAI